MCAFRVYVAPHACMDPCSSEEGIRHPRTGGTEGCGPHVHSGNGTCFFTNVAGNLEHRAISPVRGLQKLSLNQFIKQICIFLKLCNTSTNRDP